MAALLFIGFASGLPILLVLKTLLSWMSDAGTDLSKIGWYGSLIGFPYAFKYLWSPLLDRYSPPFLGRRKGWLLIIQSLLVLSIATMALQDPAQNLDLLAINSVVIAFLSASQDIVADAYRTDVLTVLERPAGMGIFTAGYRVALIVSFAGASKLFSDVFQDWRPVYLVMAGIMLVSLLLTLIAPSPTGTDRPPETLAKAIVLPFADFFQRRGVLYGALVLIFIVSYKISDAMMNAMSISFLKAACFTQSQIGDINGFMGIIAAIIGALLGAVVLARISVFQGLWIFGSLQAIGIVFYLLLAQNINPDPLVTDLTQACKNFVLPPFSMQLFVLAINVENFFGGMESSAFGLFLMNMCNKQFTATQLALLSGLMALSKLIVAPVGAMTKAVGWPNFFSISMVTVIPSLILLIVIARLNEQLRLKTRASALDQLTDRFGDLLPELTLQVDRLNLEQLEGLAEDLPEFKEMGSLSKWLKIATDKDRLVGDT